MVVGFIRHCSQSQLHLLTTSAIAIKCLQFHRHPVCFKRKYEVEKNTIVIFTVDHCDAVEMAGNHILEQRIPNK
jgi:hypothetical protein